MNYASRSTSFVGRGSAATMSQPQPAFRTRKRTARTIPCKSSDCEVHAGVETRAEVIRRESFEEMFLASRPKFIAMAHRILRNREDAEDAVQNAFLSGYLHLRSFEGRSALRTWFTRIVLNAALMLQRKRRLSPVQPFPENSNSTEADWTENFPASEPDPEMVHAERETFDCIDGIIEKMSPVLRQAYTMTYYDELSGRESCAVLGVSTGTFKARLFRAKRQVLDQAQRALVSSIHKTPSEFLNANHPRVGEDLNP